LVAVLGGRYDDAVSAIIADDPRRAGAAPMIHATAIIHPAAKLDLTVQVGPYAVIDEGVELGAQCVVGPHVYLTGRTVIGSHNVFHAGAVIGDAPQDLKYHGEKTGLRIGDHNVFREHVTVHRSNKLAEDTRVGSHNFLMAGAHVAHNCHVGDHVIMANGALLGGHVTVEDRAFISGNCLVHQFVRVGMLSLMQGGAAISKDLPPFTIASGNNGLWGLNSVGLRRAGFTAEQRMELKRLYHFLFRGQGAFSARVASARTTFKGPAAMQVLEFVAGAKRGLCADPRISRGGRSADGGEAEEQTS
jgi:UDP-N-acetylglucosamine acyltransferase